MAVELVAGVMLVVGGVSSRELRWVGRAAIVGGLALVALGALGLLATFTRAPAPETLRLIALVRPLLMGFSAGVIVTLFISGELWRRRRP